MTGLVKNPPKYQLEDGSVEIWRGMPKLPDVVGAILANREKAQQDYRKRKEEELEREMAALAQRRKEHPEEFIGIKEIIDEAQKRFPKLFPMPSVENSAILQGLDGGERERELEKQKNILQGAGKWQKAKTKADFSEWLISLRRT